MTTTCPTTEAALQAGLLPAQERREGHFTKVSGRLNAFRRPALFLIPIRKNKITRRRAEDSTPSTARRDNAVRLFFRMGIIQINRRANRTRSIHATPQTTKHFPGRQARFQCPPSQTRTTRQTGAGRIRPLNTAFAMPVGMPQILFPIKPPAPNAGRFDVYSEEKANLSSSSAGVVYRPKAANHAHRRMQSEK